MEPTDPQGAPPPPPPRRDVAGQVKPPAIALIVTAVVGIVLHAANLLANLAGWGWSSRMQPGMMDPQQQQWMQMYQGGAGAVSSVLGILLGVVVLLGAQRMMRLQNWGFALTAAILAVIPCVSPCCVLGLPFGIWAIVVLSMPEVRAAFRG